MKANKKSKKQLTKIQKKDKRRAINKTKGKEDSTMSSSVASSGIHGAFPLFAHRWESTYSSGPLFKPAGFEYQEAVVHSNLGKFDKDVWANINSIDRSVIISPTAEVQDTSLHYWTNVHQSWRERGVETTDETINVINGDLFNMMNATMGDSMDGYQHESDAIEARDDKSHMTNSPVFERDRLKTSSAICLETRWLFLWNCENYDELFF